MLSQAYVLLEAGKSSTTDTTNEEKNKESNEDASLGNSPAPIEEVGKDGETPAADKTPEAAAE